MSIKLLRELIRQSGLSSTDCIEKTDLVERTMEGWTKLSEAGIISQGIYIDNVYTYIHIYTPYIYVYI